MKHLTGALFFVCLILLVSCGEVTIPDTGEISLEVGTNVAETQTASVWTATPITPTSTPIPDQVKIIEALNNFIKGHNPLDEAIDAKFYVTEVAFEETNNPSVKTGLWITVECEYLYHSSCTAERAFVVVMEALQHENTRNKIVKQIPTTVHTLKVFALDRMYLIGIIEIPWSDAIAFAEGKLLPEQLTGRIYHSYP
jgi:hypothetical protein